MYLRNSHVSQYWSPINWRPILNMSIQIWITGIQFQKSVLHLFWLFNNLIYTVLNQKYILPLLRVRSSFYVFNKRTPCFVRVHCLILSTRRGRNWGVRRRWPEFDSRVGTWNFYLLALFAAGLQKARWAVLVKVKCQRGLQSTDNRVFVST